MCRAEITKLLGAEVCEAIISHKWSSKKLRETEIREHPDAPGSEVGACMQYCSCH